MRTIVGFISIFFIICLDYSEKRITFAIPKIKGIMKKNYKHCLIDTYCDGGYTYEDYVENCEINGIEPDTEGRMAYWEWIGEQFENDWDDLLDNIKYSKNNGKCMVFRWGKRGGYKEYEPKIFDSLVEAFEFLGKEGYDAIQAWETNSEIEVHGLDHDGTGIYCIRPMNNRRHNLDDDEICEHRNPMWFAGKYPEFIF